MTRILRKNRQIDPTALTPVGYGDGVTGFNYGIAQWIYETKELIKAIGGTVTVSSTRGSGTGTDANTSGASDLWTNEYHAAYGKGYVGVKLPAVRGVTRRFLIQRGDNSNGQTVRIKVNRTADYLDTGTPTQAPTVAGEKLLLGGGSDASPTFDTVFPGSGSYVFQGVGYSDAPQGFVAIAYSDVGDIVGGPGFFFAVDPYETDSYPVGADDASILLDPQQTPTIGRLATEGAGAVCRAWADLGGGSEDLLPARMVLPDGLGAMPANPRTSKKPIYDVYYRRDTAPTEYYGKSRLFKAYGPLGALVKTLNNLTTKDLLLLGQLVVDWDGTEPL